MSAPKLSVPASGLAGRGYRNPFTGEIVPGLTSILDAVEKPGIYDFHISQTAAFAVANVDALLNRTEEQGYRYLQYVTRRLTPDKMDEIDILNYSSGVLSDLAENGNFIHSFTEANRNGWLEEFPPDTRQDLWQMVEAYLVWASEHQYTSIATEATFFGHTPSGHGWGGTADWIGFLDGIATLGDDKTSRKVYDSHEAQLATLGSAHTWAKEVPEGTEGAVYYKIVPSVAAKHGGQVDSWWLEVPVPDFSRYGVLQIRPDDGPTPAFAEFHEIDYSLIDAGYALFCAALDVRHAQKKRKDALKLLNN